MASIRELGTTLCRSVIHGLAIGSIAALPSCSRPPSILGIWTLWSIDGVPPSEAAPERMILPAHSYGGASVNAGDVVQESQVDSVTLELLADGAFRERRVERNTLVVAARAVPLVTGLPWPSSGPFLRGEGVDTTHTLGNWRTEADSLILYRSKEAVQASIVALYRKNFPGFSDSLMRFFIGRALDSLTDQRHYSGHLEGDRLVLQHKSGRLVVFRRSPP